MYYCFGFIGIFYRKFKEAIMRNMQNDIRYPKCDTLNNIFNSQDKSSLKFYFSIWVYKIMNLYKCPQSNYKLKFDKSDNNLFCYKSLN